MVRPHQKVGLGFPAHSWFSTLACMFSIVHAQCHLGRHSSSWWMEEAVDWSVYMTKERRPEDRQCCLCPWPKDTLATSACCVSRWSGRCRVWRCRCSDINDCSGQTAGWRSWRQCPAPCGIGHHFVHYRLTDHETSSTVPELEVSPPAWRSVCCYDGGYLHARCSQTWGRQMQTAIIQYMPSGGKNVKKGKHIFHPSTHVFVWHETPSPHIILWGLSKFSDQVKPSLRNETKIRCQKPVDSKNLMKATLNVPA